jgi:hypothetical protein
MIPAMRGRLFFLATIAAAVLPALAWGARSHADHHPVVLELYTSQGCSDCPAADRIVSELANRKDVIALSLPITYWDMLGWKDTFATQENTERQKAYARAMNRSGIYTPQIIVDGKFDVVGNQRDRVDAAIAAGTSDEQGELSIPVSLALSGQRVEISIPGVRGKPKPSGTIWVMRTLSRASVDVQAGENRNHELSYSNVVRDLRRAGEWNGQPMKIELPLSVSTIKNDGMAVILQRDGYGPVLGAALLEMPSDGAAQGHAAP